MKKNNPYQSAYIALLVAIIFSLIINIFKLNSYENGLKEQTPDGSYRVLSRGDIHNVHIHKKKEGETYGVLIDNREDEVISISLKDKTILELRAKVGLTLRSISTYFACSHSESDYLTTKKKQNRRNDTLTKKSQPNRHPLASLVTAIGYLRRYDSNKGTT